jgi:hypothetical protein
MNWLNFSFWVCGIYMLYYLVIILTDLARGRSPIKSNENELSFSEDGRPALINPEEHAPQPKAAPSMIASGGKSLKDTFGMARKEMIVYTRAVSFR